MAGVEPFPSLNTSADQLLAPREDQNPRRRRRSSGLGQEIRAGDTGAPSIGTGLASIQSSSLSDSSSSSSSNGYHKRHVHHHSHGDKDAQKKLAKRRKTHSYMRRFRHFAIRHTWTIPVLILAFLLSLFFTNPTESNPVYHGIFLSYKQPLPEGADPSTPAKYAKGPWDIAFVSFYTIVLTFTREFIMQEMLRPMARWCGLRSKGKQARFMEQMYTAIYFGILGPTGLWVMSRTPIGYFNTTAFYEEYPHKELLGEMKFYYLFQAAYWAQQAIVLVLGMEKPRKDFKELIMHHIVSLSLIGLSYRFHFTYIGIAVYVTHDISDFFLATSKSLNYLDFPITNFLVGPYFALFTCVWIYLRHVLNLKILWSVLTEFRTVGSWELNWETQQYKCWISQIITAGLLSALQSLNIFWLYCILRIAYRFITEKVAEDDRSEPEDSIEEEEQKTYYGKSRTPTPTHTLLLDTKIVVDGSPIDEKAGDYFTNGNGKAYHNGSAR